MGVHFFHAERRTDGLKDTAKVRVEFRNCFAEAPRRGIHSVMIMYLLTENLNRNVENIKANHSVVSKEEYDSSQVGSFPTSC